MNFLFSYFAFLQWLQNHLRERKSTFIYLIFTPAGHKVKSAALLQYCTIVLIGKGKGIIKLDLLNSTFGSLICKRTVAENNLLKSSAFGPRILQLRPGVRQSRHCSSGQRVVAAFQSSDPCWPPNRADVRALAALLKLFRSRVLLV